MEGVPIGKFESEIQGLGIQNDPHHGGLERRIAHDARLALAGQEEVYVHGINQVLFTYKEIGYQKPESKGKQALLCAV